MTGQEPTMRRVRIEVKVVGCGVEEDVTQRIARFIAKRIAPVMPLAESKFKLGQIDIQYHETQEP